MAGPSLPGPPSPPGAPFGAKPSAFANPPVGTPYVVQTTGLAYTASGNLVFPYFQKPTKKGNSIIVVRFDVQANVTTGTVADDQGNSYVHLTGAMAWQPSSLLVDIFVASSIAGGAAHATLTQGQEAAGFAMEVAGLSNSLSVDSFIIQTVATKASPFTQAINAPNDPSAFILAVWAAPYNTSATPPNIVANERISGFTQIPLQSVAAQSTSNVVAAAAYKALNGTAGQGNQSLTWTFTTTQMNAGIGGVIIAFRSAGASSFATSPARSANLPGAGPLSSSQFLPVPYAYTAASTTIPTAISALGLAPSIGAAAPAAGVQAIGLAPSLGSAQPGGIGSISALGAAPSIGSAALTGVGALAALGAAPSAGEANLTGLGALSALGFSASIGLAFLPVPGMNFVGLAPSIGTAQLTGIGTLAAAGVAPSIGIANANSPLPASALGLSPSKGTANLQPSGLAAPGVAPSIGSAQLQGSGAITALGLAPSSGKAAISAPLAAPGIAPSIGAAQLAGKGAISALGAAPSLGLALLGASVPIGGLGIASSLGSANLTPPNANLAALGISASIGLAAISGQMIIQQLPNGVSPELPAIYQALREFIQGVIAGSPAVEVILGLDNRVAMPAAPGFIAITAIGSYRLETNIDTDVDGYFLTPLSSGTMQSNQPTRLEIRIDCYGPDSSDWAVMLGTLFRDDYAVEALAPLCAPLYADDPRMVPMISGEAQYIEHWILLASVQYDPITVTGLGFATTLDIVPINVDEDFPP